MGIAVIDHNDPPGYGAAACHACGSSIHHSDKENHPADSKSATTTTSEKKAYKSYSSPSYNNSNTETLTSPSSASTNFTKSTKDLVGNSKEFRIEHNKCDLRIIGNGNRIRIGCNIGNLQIIGNSTRLRISNNSGYIRYTGNDGRISLGSDSIQQGVDYIGNNGILKVVNSQQWNADCDNCKGAEQQKSAKKCETTATTVSGSKSPTAKAATTQPQTQTRCTAKKVKAKSASYGGDCSAQWAQFNEMFQRHDWQRFANLSLPNLKQQGTHSAKCNTNVGTGPHKYCVIDNSTKVVNNYGNIVIKNAVNVNI